MIVNRSSNPFSGSGNLTNTWFGKAVQGVADFFGDVGNVVSGAWNDITSKGISGIWDDYTGNTANRENLEYQKEYNEQVWNRADTQYQRTVADLRAAGLSSQLAAGSPSTVAGTSSAPQRTVGNESEAISKLIGMITSLKQTNASAELASAQADKARSEAALNTAELPWVEKKNSAEYMLAMANKDYTIAMTKLKMQEGDTYMQRFQADISQALSEVNRNNALVELYEKQGRLYEAQEGKTQAERKEINQRIENLKQQEKNLKQEFDNIVLSGKKIDAETQKLLQDAANAAWNLEKSKEMGLRTTDQQTKLNIFGLGSSNLETLLQTPRLNYDPFTGKPRPYGL